MRSLFAIALLALVACDGFTKDTSRKISAVPMPSTTPCVEQTFSPGSATNGVVSTCGGQVHLVISVPTPAPPPAQQ